MPRIIILAAGRILNAVSAVIAVRLYTELLTARQIGNLSLLLSVIALFNLGLIVPVSTYVIRKAIDWHADGILRLQLKRPLFYSFAAGGIATLGCWALATAGLLNASMMAAPLVGISVICLAVSSVGTLLFNYFGQPFTFVVLSCATSWGGVALAALLCLRISATGEVWLLGLTAAQLLGSGLAIVLISRLESGHPASAARRLVNSDFTFAIVAKYSLPLLLATLVAWAQTDGYRYVFVRLGDNYSLGVFVAGFAIGASPMAFVERLISDAYLPALMRDLAAKGTAWWPRCFDAYASAAILPMVLFGILACSGPHLLARLLVSQTYSAFAWIGFWGGLVKTLQMMASLYTGFAYATLETKHLTVHYSIGAAVTLFSMPVWMKMLTPVTGVAVSLACGSLAVLLSIAHVTKKRYHVVFPYAAFGRAVALGAPILAVNIAARAKLAVPSAFTAIALLGAEAIYIAAVCWVLSPKAPVLASLEARVTAGVL